MKTPQGTDREAVCISNGEEDFEEHSAPRNRRPALYITLATAELFLGGGFLALLPLFFAVVYRFKAETDPGTGTRWAALGLLIIVALYGTLCNLYSLAAFLLAAQ